MTREEFLAALVGTQGVWRMVRGRKIQSDCGECPLTRIAGIGDAINVDHAAALLNLSGVRARDIVSAADGFEQPHLRNLRNELLEACGLPQEEWE